MDMDNILGMGASLVSSSLEKYDVHLSEEEIVDALGTLVKNSDGAFDMLRFVTALSLEDLGDIVSSWLGNGENLSISLEGLESLFGEEKIEAFAQRIGLEYDGAKEVLQEAVPLMVDRATSPQESIVDKMLEGQDAMGMLSKIFS
jgi:uncharacterized protein YidB (DUF937 family)